MRRQATQHYVPVDSLQNLLISSYILILTIQNVLQWIGLAMNFARSRIRQDTFQYPNNISTYYRSESLVSPEHRG